MNLTPFRDLILAYPNKEIDNVQMNVADNWTRVFVVITFLTFGEAQVIGGIVPNLIAFSLFLGAIGYFTLTEKMAEMFGIRKRPKSD